MKTKKMNEISPTTAHCQHQTIIQKHATHTSTITQTFNTLLSRQVYATYLKKTTSYTVLSDLEWTNKRQQFLGGLLILAYSISRIEISAFSMMYVCLLLSIRVLLFKLLRRRRCMKQLNMVEPLITPTSCQPDSKRVPITRMFLSSSTIV